MRSNPHTTEWLVVGVRPSHEEGLLKLARILISLGYGSSYTWRRTREGTRDAIGLTFHDVPETTVPDLTDYSKARPVGGPYRYADNAATIVSYLGQYGRVVLGSTIRKNPATRGLAYMFDSDVYDPREEAVRAVARGTGGMWGVAVGTYGQSRSPADIVQRSWERYQDVNHLIRGRQEYEIMLGRGRQAGPLRVLPEPTAVGIRYFVWPLPASRPLPHAHRTLADAEGEIKRRYADNSPIAGALPPKRYTREELAEWLPPEGVFRERSGLQSRAASKPRPAKSRLPNEGVESTNADKITGDLLEQYRAVKKDWYADPVLMAHFTRGEPPP
jgi:hypothetical protein